MSKKHYQAIARMLHRIKPDLAAGSGLPSFERAAHAKRELIRHGMWETVCQETADVLAADSPRFDRARFIDACETGTTKGMSKRPQAERQAS